MANSHTLLITLMIVALGCDPGTPGRTVLLDIEMSNAVHADGIHDGDWTITLSSARIAIGAFYFYENAPTLQASWWQRSIDGVSSLMMPTAIAHPGDAQFSGGRVLAELPVYLDWDLLDDAPQSWPQSNAVEGAARAFGYRLPEATAYGDATPPVQAMLTGTATRADETLSFDAAFSVDTSSRRDVDGLSCDLAIKDGTKLTITVDAQRLIAATPWSSFVGATGTPADVVARWSSNARAPEFVNVRAE